MTTNPSLIAVLLVTKTKDGPSLVYHYPPYPSATFAHRGSSSPKQSQDSSGSEYDSSSDAFTTADGRRRSGSPSTGSKRDTKSTLKYARSKPEDIDEDMPERLRHAIRNRILHEVPKQFQADWEHVLGFNSDHLAKLLSPALFFNKRRFEMALDGLVFIGAPRFVRDDGLWQKKRKPKLEDDDTSSEHPSESSDSTSRPAGHSLAMFNLVFVMNPPALEYHEHVSLMYKHVVRNFAKSLKYAQAQNDYVYKESRLILELKDAGRDERTATTKLWSQISNQSTLARAIDTTYKQISHDKIAHVNFGENFDTSFQIPQALSSRFVSQPNDPQRQSGLWLTTASEFEDDDTSAIWSQTRALLLLEDDEVLQREVESDAQELSGPLSYFLHNLKPTKPLSKIAQICSLSVGDVEQLSRHLIYWRRGRAVPPLRPVDTYIVSPNASMRRLETDSVTFKAKFPTFPSLPALLAYLSIPRPYGNVIKTRALRDSYMEILAWLLRHGWVVQLRTYGWLLVQPEIKAAVELKVQQEKIEQQEPKPQAQRNGSSNSSRTRDTDSNRERRTDRERNPSPSPLRLSEIHMAASTTVPSPLLLAGSRATPDTASVGSGRSQHSFSPLIRPIIPSTSFRHSPLQESIDPSSPVHSVPFTGNASISSPVSYQSHVQSLSISATAKKYKASIICSALRASSLEVRWIEEMREQLNDQELKDFWPNLVKYFDGRQPLEEISARENLKKRRVAHIISYLVQKGALVVVRHW